MPTKRQLQAMETRQKLIDAGQRLLNEKGYDAMTIGDITEACGVAKGTFYVYFKSKGQLLGALQYEPYLALDEGFENGTGPIAEDVAAYMTGWIDYFSQFSPHFAASWLGHTDNDNPELLEDYKDEYSAESDVALARIARIERRIRRAVAEGELIEGCPAHEIAFSIATRLYGLCVWHSLSRGTVDIREGARKEAALVSRLLEMYRAQ